MVLSYTLFVVIPDLVAMATDIIENFSILTELSYIADLIIFIVMDPGVKTIIRRKKDVYTSKRKFRQGKIAVVKYKDNSIIVI